MKDHQLIHQSLSPEWYTPNDPYLIAVRACLGHIELDPASCEEANKVVQTTRFYTACDNGLVQPCTALATGIADLDWDDVLHPQGVAVVEWAEKAMPVSKLIRSRFEKEKPLKGVRLSLAFMSPRRRQS